LERRLRLRQDHDVRAARSRGQAIAEGPIVFRFLRNGTEPPTNRYAVIAGRKSGGSVQRNRLKRIVREALRSLHPEINHGYDVAVIIRGTIEDLPGSPAAREVLARIARRAGLMHQSAALHQAEP
jgi:ribonuclease P protein component